MFPAARVLTLNDDGYMVLWGLADPFPIFEVSFSVSVMGIILLCYVYVFSIVRTQRIGMKKQGMSESQISKEYKILIQSFIIFLGMTSVLASAYSYFFFSLIMDEYTANILFLYVNEIFTVVFYCMNPVLYVVFSTQIRELLHFWGKGNGKLFTKIASSLFQSTG